MNFILEIELLIGQLEALLVPNQANSIQSKICHGDTTSREGRIAVQKYNDQVDELIKKILTYDLKLNKWIYCCSV